MPYYYLARETESGEIYESKSERECVTINEQVVHKTLKNWRQWQTQDVYKKEGVLQEIRSTRDIKGKGKKPWRIDARSQIHVLAVTGDWLSVCWWAMFSNFELNVFSQPLFLTALLFLLYIIQFGWFSSLFNVQDPQSSCQKLESTTSYVTGAVLAVWVWSLRFCEKWKGPKIILGNFFELIFIIKLFHDIFHPEKYDDMKFFLFRATLQIVKERNNSHLNEKV